MFVRDLDDKSVSSTQIKIVSIYDNIVLLHITLHRYYDLKYISELLLFFNSRQNKCQHYPVKHAAKNNLYKCMH